MTRLTGHTELTRRPRWRMLPILIATLLLAVAAGQQQQPQGTRYVDRVFDDVEVARDIVYRTTTTHTGETIDLRLDIYEPAGDTEEERPAIFWMFGGGWVIGDRNQLSNYAEDSARRGYVGVTVDYRIRPEGGELADMAWDAYDDAVGAAQWLTEHAAEHRIDPDAVIAAGYSAGAINALHLLYAPGTRGPEESPVAGAVAIAGFSFVAPPAERPPAVIHSGTEDPIVSPELSAGTCDSAVEAGNDCELVSYEGSDHLLAFTDTERIMEETARLVHERMLVPLGYEPAPGGEQPGPEDPSDGDHGDDEESPTTTAPVELPPAAVATPARPVTGTPEFTG